MTRVTSSSKEGLTFFDEGIKWMVNVQEPTPEDPQWKVTWSSEWDETGNIWINFDGGKGYSLLSALGNAHTHGAAVSQIIDWYERMGKEIGPEEGPPPIPSETYADLVDGMATARKPFEFYREDDDSLSLESAVYQAIGAGSVCWESMENTGIFQSERAAEIAEALLEVIRDCTLAELIKQTREQP